MEESFDNIRQAIDQLLNTKSAIKRKKQTKQIHNRELFISIINSIQMIGTRANLAFSDLKLDFSTYDEPFLEIIDALLLLKYGKEACELISFYLWERENPDGSINDIYDEDNNRIPLETPIDLWNIILKVNPNLDK
jgi:hypothetical protein